MLSLLKPKSLIGLDFHPESIRLTQLQSTSDGVRVSLSATQPLSPGVIQEGKILSPSDVLSALKKIVWETKIKKFPVAIALPSQAVIHKYIQIPSVLQPHECEIEIETRLSHYLPGTEKELLFDFFILNTTASHHEVLLIAVRKDSVADYERMIAEAGLQLSALDVDAYALARAAQFFLPASSLPIVVIEAAKNTARFVIFQGQKCIFSQQFSFTQFFHLSEAIRRALQIHFPSGAELDFFLAGENVSEIKHFLEKEFQTTLYTNDRASFLTSFGLALRRVAGAQY